MKKFTLLMLTVLCGLLITSCKNELATEKSSEDFVTVTLNLNGNARNISPCNVIDNKKVKITKVEFVNANNPEKSITYTKDIGETYSIRPGVYAVKVYGVYSLEGRNQEIEDGIEIQEGSSQTSSNLMEAKVFGETEPFSIENNMDISVMISLTKEGTGGFEFDFIIPDDYMYDKYVLKLVSKNNKDDTKVFSGEWTYSNYYTFKETQVKSGIYSLEFYGTAGTEMFLFDFPCELIEIADDLTVANTFELDESVINERIGSTTLYATTGPSKGNGFFSEFPANVNDIFAIVEGYTTKERGIDVEVYKENPDDEIIFDAAKVKSSKRINFDIEKDSITRAYYFIDNAFEVGNGSFDFVIDNSNGLKNPTGMNIKMENYSCYRELNATIRNGAFVNVDVTEPEFEESSPDGFMDGSINIKFSKIEDFLDYYNNHNKIAVIKTNNEIESEMFGSCFYVYVDYEELEEAEIVYKQIKVEDGYLYEVYLEEAH